MYRSHKFVFKLIIVKIIFPQFLIFIIEITTTSIKND